MSTLVLKNVQISNFGTAIKMSVHDTVIADGLSISGNNVAFDVIDGPRPREAMSELHWVDVLALCFALVRKSQGGSDDERRAAFLNSEFGQMLANSHDVDRLLEQVLAAEAQGFSVEHLMSHPTHQWLNRGDH